MHLAIVHDYLNQMGGAEQIVLRFARLFPNAPIYTSLYEPDRVDPAFARSDVRVSFMQRLPFVRRLFRLYLPLYPFAFESFDLRRYDVVLSCTTAWTKGVLTDPQTCHIAYVNTPARFAWRTFDYLESESIPALLRPFFHALMHHFRIWDFSCQARVDHLVANSENVAHRVRKFYRRPCAVIHPPVDTARFEVGQGRGEGFLLISRLRAYKRLHVVIEAVNQLKAPLTVVGEGPDRARLERLAGPTVRFAGRVGDGELARLLAACRALVVPAEEDFGIAGLEANASGRPVVALGRGGALETVVPANGYPARIANAGELSSREEEPTGVFFPEQTSEAVAAAIRDLDRYTFSPAALRAHAERFDARRFDESIRSFVERAWDDHRARFATLRRERYRAGDSPPVDR